MSDCQDLWILVEEQNVEMKRQRLFLAKFNQEAKIKMPSSRIDRQEPQQPKKNKITDTREE